MTEPLRVIFVEDSPTDCKLIVRELRREGGELIYERVQDAESLRALLERGGWDLILSDWSMPRFSAAQALTIAKALAPDVPFIIVSGTVGEVNAVEAMRAGASDYVLKENLSRLVPAVERELREREVRKARRAAEEARDRAEEQLRQAQKLEAIGSLAGGIAHDFNNLLSVILSYAQMLRGDLPADNPMVQDLEQIELAGQRAATLTRQLLAFSRRQVLQPRVTNLDEIVRGIEKILQRLIGEDIELTLCVGDELGMVEVDPGQIEQVLLNLASNARDAMPNGGQLNIEIKNVDIDAPMASAHPGVKPGSYVLLAMSDTGLGMDAETQARIFEPFFTTKEIGRGTGLGLPTVLGIVEQSGGHVWVSSEPGQGTTFKLFFGRIQTSQRPTQAPTKRVTDTESLRGSETILLVEDDAAVRRIASSILRRAGYRVIEAEDGHQALAVSASFQGPIQLLVTDVVMPRMNGPELADSLLDTRPEMSVLFVSGYTEHAVIHNGVLDPSAAFIHKPLTPEALSRKVRELLDARPTASGRRPPPTSSG